jgi:hypothetical protein
VNGSRTRIVRRVLPVLAGALAAALGLALIAPAGEAREDGAGARSASEMTAVVDRLVSARLEQSGVTPAPRSDDDEFLRRIYLDVVGTVPTPEEVEAFLADRSPDKRARKIDELLASETYAEHWATWWYRTLTGSSVNARPGRNGQGNGQGGRYLAGEAGKRFHAWLSDQMAANRPYDEIVEALVTATGRTDENGAAGYLARWEGNANNTAGAVAKHFLGTQIQCAQCHDHIYEPDWKQADFQGMASFFALTTVRRVPEYRELQMLRRELGGDRDRAQKDAGEGDRSRPGKRDGPGDRDGGDRDGGGMNGGGMNGGGMDGGMDAPEGRGDARQRLRQLVKYRNIVDVQDMRASPRHASRLARRLERAKNPELQARAVLMSTTPKFWLAAEAPDLPGISRRYLLARWITDEANPYFARTLANRMWAAFMGRGIVDPVDDFNSFNEPSHPDLLAILAQDFVQSGHDLERLMRILLNSETYQRTSRWTGDEPSPRLFAKGPVRPLSTEQLYFALMRATGLETQLGRATRRQQQRLQQAIFAAFSFVFDDDEGKEEQDFEGSIPQGLFLMNGELLQRAISGGDPRRAGGRARRRPARETPLERLLRDEPSDAARVTRLYLQAYGRKPDASERSAALRFVKKGGGEVKAYEDLLWAILNSAEFMTNH